MLRKVVVPTIVVVLCVAGRAQADPAATGSLARGPGANDLVATLHDASTGGERFEFSRLFLNGVGNASNIVMTGASGGCSFDTNDHSVFCSFQGPDYWNQDITVSFTTDVRVPDDGGGALKVCVQPCSTDSGPYTISGPPAAGGPPAGGGTTTPPPTSTGPTVTTPPPCHAHLPSPFSARTTTLMETLGELADIDLAIRRLKAARRRLPRTDRLGRTALQNEIRTLQNRRAEVHRGLRVAAHAADGGGLPAQDVVNGFADAFAAAAKSKLDADKATGKVSEKDAAARAGKIDKLAEQVKTLGKLAAGGDLSAAEREEILGNAIVGLTGEIGGKDTEELAGEAKTLIGIIRGKTSEKDKKKLLEKKVASLAEKLVKLGGGSKDLAKGVKELTQQITTLVKLAGGELTDAEREQIFNQAVLGLLERTVFNGLLNPIYLKAATAGYDFAKPFGDAIARGLKTAASAEIFNAANIAIQRKDQSYAETIGADHTQVIATTVESGSYVGWSVTAYWDPTANQVVLKAVPGEDTAMLAKTRKFIRALFGSTPTEFVFDPSPCDASQAGNVMQVGK